MVRSEAIEWLKSIKEKYIHGGDDFYDHQRRTAIDYAVNFLDEQKPMTNADRIRAMSDEELEQFINHFNICDIRTNEECKMSYCACCEVCVMDWLQQPAEGETMQIITNKKKKHIGAGLGYLWFYLKSLKPYDFDTATRILCTICVELGIPWEMVHEASTHIAEEVAGIKKENDHENL